MGVPSRGGAKDNKPLLFKQQVIVSIVLSIVFGNFRGANAFWGKSRLGAPSLFPVAESQGSKVSSSEASTWEKRSIGCTDLGIEYESY